MTRRSRDVDTVQDWDWRQFVRWKTVLFLLLLPLAIWIMWAGAH